MTPEQRAEALAKAKSANAERARVKADLKSGAAALADVLGEAAESDVIGRMRVLALLQSLPGVGKARAEKAMERIGIDEKRRLRGLGANQQAALIEFASTRA
jgi:hypothetical protein